MKDIKLLLAEEHKNPNEALKSKMSFKDKCSEKLTAFFGSWGFIGCVCLFLIIWIVLNTYVLKTGFDPYPYILLNLCLSLLATIQNPIIQMGSNLDMLKNKIREDENFDRNQKSEQLLEYLVTKIDKIEKDNIELKQQNNQLLIYINSQKDKDNNV